MTLLYVILVSFALWIFFQSRYRKRERKQYQTALTEAFGNLIDPIPNLKTSNSYGFPHFEVTFKNKNLLEQAENNGLTQLFSDRIKEIHSNFKEFEAERAIYFTWEGRTFTIVTPPQ